MAVHLPPHNLLAFTAKRMLGRLSASVVVSVVDGDGLSRLTAQACSPGDRDVVILEVHPADLHKPPYRDLLDQWAHEFGYGLVA